MTSPIPGFKLILMGAPGSGKSDSLRTLNGLGLKVRLLAVDPNYSSSTVDSRGLEGIKVYRYVPVATQSWSVMMDNARKINTLNNEQLQKLPNISGAAYTQFIDILEQCNDFKDSAGVSYGDISKWGTDTVLCLDGLSGLSDASEKLTVGAKPVKSQPDWGVMMDNLGNFLQKIAKDCWCHVVLVSHLDREQDGVTQQVKLRPLTLGNKLSPKIPKDWTDVVLSKAVAGKFLWSTTDVQADLKSMHLPFRDDLAPNFKQVLDGWLAKGGILSEVRG